MNCNWCSAEGEAEFTKAEDEEAPWVGARSRRNQGVALGQNTVWSGCTWGDMLESRGNEREMSKEGPGHGGLENPIQTQGSPRQPQQQHSSLLEPEGFRSSVPFTQSLQFSGFHCFSGTCGTILKRKPGRREGAGPGKWESKAYSLL